MTREEFEEILNNKEYSYKEEGNRIEVNHMGYVDLRSTNIPEGTIFSGGGSVNLSSLTALPEEIAFCNGISVHLTSINTISKGTVFANTGDIDLSSVKTIPKGIVFSNEGDVYLGSLIGGWISNWEGNIKGIDYQRLLNKMISLGLFDRK
jgi:hypothetical protein